MCISLRPSTYVMGSKVNLGSFSQGSKGHFHQKCFFNRLHGMACNSLNKYTWDPQFHSWGQGQLGVTSASKYHATVSRSVSKGRKVLLSFFLTICFFFHMLDRIFTKLGQKQVWVDGYKTYGSKKSSGVIWGHRGQKDDFTKNASPPTDYMVWSGD